MLDKFNYTEHAKRIEELCNLYPKTWDAIKSNVYKKYDTIERYFKSYSCRMAFYNKMFDENNLTVSGNDYTLLSNIAVNLKKEHLINWTRNKLYEVDINKNCDMFMYMIDNFICKGKDNVPIKIEVFKIWWYIVHHVGFLIKDSWTDSKVYLDDYILKHIPELKQFLI